MAWFGVSILKIFMIMLTSISFLFSFDVLHIKAHIFAKIAHEFIDKEVVNIYTDDKSLLKTKGIIPTLKFTTREESDIVFLSKEEDIDCEGTTKYIFSTSYKMYKSSKDVIGAFFWQKGRPNIIIKLSMLKKLDIELSQEFQKYVE